MRLLDLGNHFLEPRIYPANSKSDRINDGRRTWNVLLDLALLAVWASRLARFAAILHCKEHLKAVVAGLAHVIIERHGVDRYLCRNSGRIPCRNFTTTPSGETALLPNVVVAVGIDRILTTILVGHCLCKRSQHALPDVVGRVNEDRHKGQH